MSDQASDIDSSRVPTLANGYRLQFEKTQDTWVLLYPEGMVKLNTSASEILKRCDGKTSVSELIKQLEAAFDASDLTEDVNAFMAIALEQHWITLESSYA